MYTFKFEGLTQQDAQTPYYYGSLPAKPELGHFILFHETGNRYVIYRIDGEGLTEGKARDNEWELASADMVRGESVPTIWLKKKTKVTPKIKVRYKKAEVTKKTEVTQKASGRSFSAEEVKAFSKRNRKKRLSAAK